MVPSLGPSDVRMLRRWVLALGLCALAAPLPAHAAQFVRRINVNGPEFVGTDFPGTWEADPGVCGPFRYQNDTEIHNTVDDPLFTGEAFGNPMTCRIDDQGQPLPPATYTVRLLFAEIYWGPGCPGEGSGTGSRVFDVELEGQTVESGIDLFAEAGCAASTTDPTGAPVTRTYSVPITDGALDIVLAASKDAGKISAIELIGPQCSVDADCDDGNVCTDDVCNAGQCEFTPNTAPCSDGNACTTGDVCSQGTCQSGAPQVCDDGDACNGVETCDASLGCQAGTPLHCDDSDACNGVETCNPSLGCQAGTPLHCDDGDACDGVETCDPELACQAGTALDCDDGNVCTADSCDAVLGCAHSPIQGCGPQVPGVPPWGYMLVGALLLGAARIASSSRRGSAG